jgi:hypothetical protein
MVEPSPLSAVTTTGGRRGRSPIHGFLAVIDSCSTVASDTQTK